MNQLVASSMGGLAIGSERFDPSLLIGGRRWIFCVLPATRWIICWLAAIQAQVWSDSKLRQICGSSGFTVHAPLRWINAEAFLLWVLKCLVLSIVCKVSESPASSSCPQRPDRAPNPRGPIGMSGSDAAGADPTLDPGGRLCRPRLCKVVCMTLPGDQIQFGNGFQQGRCLISQYWATICSKDVMVFWSCRDLLTHRRNDPIKSILIVLDKIYSLQSTCECFDAFFLIVSLSFQFSLDAMPRELHSASSSDWTGFVLFILIVNGCRLTSLELSYSWLSSCLLA